MNFIVEDYWVMVLLSILVIISLAILLMENVIYSVVIYGAFTLISALVWLEMNSPDLAITEAAAGIAMTILMMVVIYRTNREKEA